MAQRPPARGGDRRARHIGFGAVVAAHGGSGTLPLLLYDCGEAMGSSSVRAELRAALGRVPVSADETAEALATSRTVPFEVAG